MSKVYDILKGKFLINDDAIKNWKFIVFCTVLAIVMIGSSHNAESKVHEIAKLNNDVRELRSEFVDGRSRLMHMKMESTVTKKMASREIKPSLTPPYKIKVNAKN